MTELLDSIPPAVRPYLTTVTSMAAGALAGYLLARLLLGALARLGRRSRTAWALSVHANLAGPIKLLGVVVGALALTLVFDEDGAGHPMYGITEQLIEIVLYGTCAWFAVEAVEVGGDLLLSRYDYATATDNYRQRKAYTQVLYIKRVVTVVAVVLAIAFVLFQFDRVRELGAGLLAGAGVAGIVVGFAAQKSLANLLAGFQIAFTQPIRIDDQVVIAGEFGRIEEITLTYVVVRIWDDRRLIVPLEKVINEPFQNWSRRSTELLGPVMLYLDYGVDLDALRTELNRLAEAHEAYDGRLAKLQVTDTSETAMTVRVLVSAPSPGEAFDLRCHVREGLLSYLRAHQPAGLPVRRGVLTMQGAEGAD